MAFVLEVEIVRAPANAVLSSARKIIAEEGGSVGRGPDNTWMLDDPDRYLSGKHCSFTFDGRQFYITDQSTNGTFLNNAPDAIGRGNQAPINDGDFIELGKYTLLIRLLNERTDVSEPRLSPECDHSINHGESSVTDLHASAPNNQDSTNAISKLALNINQDEFEIGDRTALSGNLDKDNGLLGRQNSNSASPRDPDNHEPEYVDAHTPDLGEIERNIGGQMLEAMGLDAQNLSLSAQREIARTIGALMPIVVEGMMDILRSRASIKNEFRMGVTTIQPVENNPLKFSATTREAMETLFVKNNTAYKDAVDSFIDGFTAISEHQIAMIKGIRAAFTSLIERFDPELLQAQFDKQAKNTVAIPGMQKVKYWGSYVDYYQSSVDDTDHAFHSLFGDIFVRAYEEHLRQLRSARHN